MVANKNQESNRLDKANGLVTINIRTHIEFLDKHIKEHKDLNDKSKLLNSIPGIGQKTIGVILVFLTLENFDSAKLSSCFCWS